MPARGRRNARRRRVAGAFLCIAVVAFGLGIAAAPASAADPCGAGGNEITCENSKPGNPASEWDVSGAGDTTIQGFTTDISTNQGGTVSFKVRTDAADYRLDIYRLGWYGGLGARKVATVQPSIALPQTQPACVTATNGRGPVDCGNWAVSATWQVPTDAVSGIYVAKLVRADTGGASHVVFVVRDDDGASNLLFQTSDTTWQAYNRWGGQSLYYPSSANRGYRVSYNRPFDTRGYAPQDWLFNAEYPMLRFLEANGYDVSYTTGVDTARRGSELLEHRTFLSVGHDEYWSGTQRTNVENARDAGVDLAFFSGNEVFWKTRWEPSTAGPSTANRTLVSYKETLANAKIDPSPEWTGTWRDPRFSPPSDGGRPENALTGTLFTVNGPRNDAMVVPAADGRMRLWRGTAAASLSPGASKTFPAGTLGYEWDEDPDDPTRPAGSIRLSTTTLNVPGVLQDYGSTFAAGTATHHLTLHRASSGALVFGAGTVQWSWGLDTAHDRGVAPSGTVFTTDATMRQATVNLFADMGNQPASLQSGLTAATASTDTTAPTATVVAPSNGATVGLGGTVTVSGTAADGGGGVVGGVEVSVDGGATWHPADGRESWSYAWTPATGGTATIRARAVDDSGNIGAASAGVSVNVSSQCPCSLFAPTATPATASVGDTRAVELGVRFSSDVSGVVRAIRFYKGSANTGTHTGQLWSAKGTLLASTTFTNETASGWQQMSFATPVAITAGTTYVAAYHTTVGRYSKTTSYFATTGVDRGPLHAPSAGNGVYRYGPAGSFPASTSNSSNYWVDVVVDTQATDTTPPTVTARTPAAGATDAGTTTDVTATFNEPIDQTTLAFQLRDAGGALVTSTTSYDETTRTATLHPSAPLAASATYRASISASDVNGNAMTSADTWTFTTAGPQTTSSLWPSTATPAIASASDTAAVEVGVKFRSDVAGTITALRFYQGPTGAGPHVGHLWSSTGTLLGTATFPDTTQTGWQQAPLATPVSITAGTTYVASYHAPVGGYSIDRDFFATTGVDRPPLHAPSTTDAGGNGVYTYGPSGSFPTSTSRASNYWVDVVLQTGTSTDVPPSVTARTPAPGATGVSTATTVTATFSESIDPATLAFSLRDGGGATVAATATYDGTSRTATLTPGAALAAGTTYTASVRASDTSGNAMPAADSWTFTTASTAASTYSLWGTPTPALIAAGDTNAVELGVKFRTSVPGTITALRFYKSSTNTGTHVGRLWNAGTGALLAEVTFTGETASGWQTMALPTPVALATGQTYIASYHTTVGHYSEDKDYFATAAVTSGPLTAPATGTVGGNGVYRYGTGGVLPTSTARASNYWVDVVFRPT